MGLGVVAAALHEAGHLCELLDGEEGGEHLQADVDPMLERGDVHPDGDDDLLVGAELARVLGDEEAAEDARQALLVLGVE